HPLRIGLCGRTVAVLQIAIPAPQYGQLHSLAYDRRKIVEKKIEPLLPGHATDDAEQKRIGRGLQTKPPLQGRLVGRPVLENVGFETTRHVRIETAGDVRIRRGIPDRNIDSVEDSAEVTGAIA